MGGEGTAIQPGSAEGFPSLRSAVGAHSDQQRLITALDTSQTTDRLGIDIRGKTRVSVYVDATAATEAILVALDMQISGGPWYTVETKTVALGTFDTLGGSWSAHRARVRAWRVTDPQPVKLAISATHGG